jgi:cell shape-determining protein MreC
MDLSGVTVDLGVIIGVLYAIVAVMVIIVLYHILFIVVDLRKIARRFEDVTSQVEAVILKPLAIADQAMQWVTHLIEQQKRKHAHHKHTSDDDEDEETEESAS